MKLLYGNTHKYYILSGSLFVGPCTEAQAMSAPAPATINYALGNTYTLLPIDKAPLDYTRRHHKVHDWVLYIDILPGWNPDLVDRVTFDMRDDSFRGLSFTCHCPIRTQVTSLNTVAGGEALKEESIVGRRTGEATEERKVLPTNPRPRNSSRWRFSTRQQTYGAVDTRITIRGIGGSKSVVEYKIVLKEDAPEVFGTFVERRPNSIMKPIKMTEDVFEVNMNFILGASGDTDQLSQFQRVENRELLQRVGKCIYSRSKRPMKAVLRNPYSGESWIEEWFGEQSKETSDNAWTLSLACPNVNESIVTSAYQTLPIAVSLSSPDLVGGDGLNECYKVIEGLPSYLTTPTNSNEIRYSKQEHSMHVRIDVSKLSLSQIIKVAQNVVKYEEAIDSFMPWYRREDCCSDCLSNKFVIKDQDLEQQLLNNKERNDMIGKCATFRDLIACINPEEDKCYKLNFRNLIVPSTDSKTNGSLTVEFRQHPSSKDKTTTTHWIRFCMALVQNSARLRSPMALKNTTSIEDEFDLLFEYVIKDRALRNFYRERRDRFAARKEEERLERFAMTNSVVEEDAMNTYDNGDEEEHNTKPNLKRNGDVEKEATKNKRQSS
jgi:hypothetical protein